MLYNIVEQKRSWGRWDEPSPNTARPVFIREGVSCMWWDWRGVLCYEGLPENQTINFNKHRSQLDQLKAALDEKPPELAKRRCAIFPQDNQGPMLFDDQSKTVTALLGSSDSSSLLTSHHTFGCPPILSLQNSHNGKRFQLPGRL